MQKDFLFTSESVSEGHPDKIADQISDAILDSILEQDRHARVACETMVTTDKVMLGGEVTTTAIINVEQITRSVIRDIGYNKAGIGFDAETCAITSVMGKQSPDIARGVDKSEKELQGAGDQGLMFGYASNETSVLMPAPITYAHQLMMRQAQLRKSGALPWLLPDAKSQITFRYVDNIPVSIHTVVLSTQHDPDIAQAELIEAVVETIIKPTLPEKYIDKNTQFLVNPTGRFVIGGPHGDCGLTGRKIIVDSYGGSARHGGGAFSGKDPSKVDRSGAYAARYVAKNIVAAGLANRCEIQIAYAIGIAEPIAINIETFGTGKIAEEKIIKLIWEHFDLRPFGIIKMLDLLHPFYRPTSSYGHFGRTDIQANWEKIDKADVLHHAGKH